MPSGGFEELQRILLMLAIIAVLVVDRIFPFRRENFRRHLGFDLVQDLELAPLGQTLGRKIRVLEKAVEPHIGPVKQLLVRLFEIEQQVERLPHARVLELRAPRVERERLHSGDALHRQRLFLHEALFQRIEIILGRPRRSAVLHPEIELARLEIFERR